MKCEKVLKELPAYVLDELDLEKCKGVAEHSESCNACKLESHRIERVYKLIKTSSQLDTSVQRRETAVNAMGRADLTKGNGFKRRLLISGIAAGALLGILVFILWHNAKQLKLVLEEVDGTVLALNKADWEPLSAQSAVSEGAWITTQPNTLAKFRLEISGKVLGALYLSAGDLVKVIKSGDGLRDIQIFINKGVIYGELEPLEGCKYVVTSGQNDSAIVKSGDFEAGLKYTLAIRKSSPPPPDKDSYAISYTNLPLGKVVEFISKNTNKSIDVSSRQVEMQRVNFYSNGASGEAIFTDFEVSLKSQGLAIVKGEKGRIKIISMLSQPHGILTQRLFIKMSKGVAEVYSNSKKRIIEPYQECTIDSEGYIVARKVKNTEIAQWRDAKSRNYFSEGNIPIFMDVALDEGGCRVSKRELSANIGDKNVEITIPDIVVRESEEFVVPMKVKVGKVD